MRPTGYTWEGPKEVEGAKFEVESSDGGGLSGSLGDPTYSIEGSSECRFQSPLCCSDSSFINELICG